MSTFDSDVQGMPGYFLPEDSQLRLKNLREYTRFLSRVTHPRTHDEQQDWAPEVTLGGLAICLELLAEQADLVLTEVSWQTGRATSPDAPGEVVRAAQAPDEEASRFAFGVTLHQIDALDRAVQVVAAHGDVLAKKTVSGTISDIQMITGMTPARGARG